MGEIKVSIQRIDSRILLQVGTEQIEISDYNLKSSADGTTELNVTISGNLEWNIDGATGSNQYGADDCSSSGRVSD